MLEWPLEIMFYMVIITCMIGYAVLDGFDLGVGILLLVARKDQERRILLNAIGPVWDGNAVWLIIVIGSLFAGFPNVYATVFSAFYIPSMLMLCALIFRAVAIEVRSKKQMRWWRSLWDCVFSFSSLMIALGVGMAIGNFVEGIPLDENFNFNGGIWDLLSLYSVLMGVVTVALFTMHGAIYLVMKTEGDLHDRIRNWARRSVIFFLMTYWAATIITLIYFPHMVEQLKERPGLFVVGLLAMFAIANIPRELSLGHDGRAFISSCVTIASLLALYSLGSFPELLRSSINPAHNSLTIYNSSSSKLTLTVLGIIVAIGVPLVIGYGIVIYRVFRGKVRLDSMSY